MVQINKHLSSTAITHRLTENVTRCSSV